MSILSKQIRFPYNYKRIDFGRVVDPTISLDVKAEPGWKSFDFLIDSGADTTTIPIYFTKLVKTEINKRGKTSIGGVEGNGIVGYPGKIWIRLNTDVLSVRCYFIESDVTPLLGRVDIWNKYTIIFDNMRKEVVFEKL